MTQNSDGGEQLELDFNPALPIYTQIVEGFKREILSGDLAPGEKVPPVRELATELGVNPNTLQRAMTELEREGLMYTERTTGRYVTNDGQLIDAMREELIAATVDRFLEEMRSLGCSVAEVERLIRKHGGNRNE